MQRLRLGHVARVVEGSGAQPTGERQLHFGTPTFIKLEVTLQTNPDMTAATRTIRIKHRARRSRGEPVLTLTLAMAPREAARSRSSDERPHGKSRKFASESNVGNVFSIRNVGKNLSSCPSEVASCAPQMQFKIGGCCIKSIYSASHRPLHFCFSSPINF